MSLISDLLFCLKPRCPVCGKGRLFKKFSLTLVDECSECHAKLGANDVGDGASVFLIFILGFSVIPTAWLVEKAFSPPAWFHIIVWPSVMLGMIAVLMPAVKAYIILLEWRHRKHADS